MNINMNINMNIYKISQTTNRGYDTFDSAIVIAASPKAAALIHPQWIHDPQQLYVDGIDDDAYSSWTNSNNVTATYIGKASNKFKKPQVVMASFNAG